MMHIYDVRSRTYSKLEEPKSKENLFYVLIALSMMLIYDARIRPYSKLEEPKSEVIRFYLIYYWFLIDHLMLCQ